MASHDDLDEQSNQSDSSTTASNTEVLNIIHDQQIQPQPVPQLQSSLDSRKKRLFAKELRCMMYGFGDDQNPYTETVDMLEDLVIHFIGDIALKALEVGRSGRVTVEDVMYLVRRDPRKYSRVRDLLSMNEELKKARKAFDEVKYVQSV